MAINVIMPALGMSQDTGRIISWLKEAGSAVVKGEMLLEIETDKATVEVEAPATGILREVSAHAGEDVPVGTVIAIIADAEEAADSPQFVGSAAVTTDHKPTRATPLAQRIAKVNQVEISEIQPKDGDRIKKSDVLAFVASRQVSTADYRLRPASPKARTLATRLGLQLTDISGTGPEGAVLVADIERAAGTRASAVAADRPLVETPQESTDQAVIPVSSTWRIMAERLSQSWSQTPHFYLQREINASRLIEWRKSLLENPGPKVTFTDLLVKLFAEALRRHPQANARWSDGKILKNAAVNVGLAVAVEQGLVVPVIRAADTLTISEIAARRAAYVERAQAGKLRPEDIQDGSCTLSNLGMYGVDSFSAIVNPPQAVILAVGRIAERVMAVNGQAVVAPSIIITLSCDHRVVDGAHGAQMMQTLITLIEEPLKLLN